MSQFTKGGRGKKAPYSSSHFRIPDPIKPVVAIMADVYRESCDDEGIFQPQALLEETANRLMFERSPKPDNTEAISLLKEALTMKANSGGAIKDKIRQALALMK